MNKMAVGYLLRGTRLWTRPEWSLAGLFYALLSTTRNENQARLPFLKPLLAAEARAASAK
jgi:hypothetical protein